MTWPYLIKLACCCFSDALTRGRERRVCKVPGCLWPDPWGSCLTIRTQSHHWFHFHFESAHLKAIHTKVVYWINWFALSITLSGQCHSPVRSAEPSWTIFHCSSDHWRRRMGHAPEIAVVQFRSQRTGFSATQIWSLCPLGVFRAGSPSHTGHLLELQLTCLWRLQYLHCCPRDVPGAV